MLIGNRELELRRLHFDAEDVAQMTGEQRLRLAFLLSELEHEIVKLRLRNAHPKWSETRVKIEFIRIVFHPQPLPKWLEKQLMASALSFVPKSLSINQLSPAARYT